MMNRRVHGKTVTVHGRCGEDDHHPGHGDGYGELPGTGCHGGQGGQFGAEPPDRPGGAVMHLRERPVQDIGIVAVVARGVLRHHDHPARVTGSHAGHGRAW